MKTCLFYELESKVSFREAFTKHATWQLYTAYRGGGTRIIEISIVNNCYLGHLSRLKNVLKDAGQILGVLIHVDIELIV